jgi:hypothetical protein
MNRPAGVDGLAHAIGAACCCLIDLFRLARSAVERKRAGMLAIAVNGIKEALVSAEYEEGRIDQTA